jgi:hypothetical protein
VMKILMPQVAGRAAGDQVSAVVKELLSKASPGTPPGSNPGVR